MAISISEKPNVAYFTLLGASQYSQSLNSRDGMSSVDKLPEGTLGQRHILNRPGKLEAIADLRWLQVFKH